MRYGSVCSGIEAASVAWHPLGWEPQWFSEIEHFPSAVLKYRFPDVPNLGDMTQLNQNPIFNEQSIDLLVGGTPCQSFSVAGLRKGLADPRGNLMLTFLSIADKRRPKWIVWENVPGVLSSNGGKDFGTFLGALGELGYGFAYRILDAQHFGVAQRRRRVFVVGYLGDWRPAAAVLFESESLQRNPKPSRAKRKETPTDAQGGSRTTSPDGRETIGTLRQRDYKGIGNDDLESGRGLAIEIKDAAQPVHAFKVRGGCEGGGKGYLGEDEKAFTISAMQDQQIAQPITYGIRNDITPKFIKENSGTLTTRNVMAVSQPIAYSFDSLASNSMKSSNPHSGCREVETSKTIDTTTPEPSKNQGGIAIVQPISIAENTIGRQPMNGGNGDGFTEDGPMYTLNATGIHGVAQPIAVDWRTTQVDIEKTGTLKTDLAKMSGPCVAVDAYNYTTNEHTTQTIRSQCDTEHIGAVLQPKVFDWQSGGDARGLDLKDTAQLQRCQTPALLHTMAIRRLTPKECERLQGFPDDWTNIPYRNKPADQCPDGPRYKACGNSMAVPVMRWIGTRIQMIENYLNP